MEKVAYTTSLGKGLQHAVNHFLNVNLAGQYCALYHLNEKANKNRELQDKTMYAKELASLVKNCQMHSVRRISTNDIIELKNLGLIDTVLTQKGKDELQLSISSYGKWVVQYIEQNR